MTIRTLPTPKISYQQRIYTCTTNHALLLLTGIGIGMAITGTVLFVLTGGAA